MNRSYRSFDSYLTERLRDPQRARDYLEIALEEYESDGDRAAFLLALRTVAVAQGGVGKLAERTGLNRESLYRTLSAKGNPRLDTVSRVLSGLGFRLALQPAEPA
jgi:probable addiction module antidote protein